MRSTCNEYEGFVLSGSKPKMAKSSRDHTTSLVLTFKCQLPVWLSFCASAKSVSLRSSDCSSSANRVLASANCRCNSSVQRIDSKGVPGIEVSSGTSFFDLADSVTFSPSPARSRPSRAWALKTEAAVFVSAFIREADVPVGKAVPTKPENALTMRLRLVCHCGPFLAARRQTRMRHSTSERNSTLVSVCPPVPAPACPALETNRGSISSRGVLEYKMKTCRPGPPFRAARDVPHELTSFEPEVLESLAFRDRDQTRVIEGEER